MKRYSKSYVKMQIKTTMRYHSLHQISARYTYYNGQNPEHWHHHMLTKSKRNSHSLLVGMQNGTATFEGSLLLSYKSKYTLTRGTNSCIPLYLAKGVENLCSQKKPAHGCLYYSSLCHNCQNLEATKMSFSWWWVNKLVHPNNRILFST